jgi:tRNA threonylcarbamoyladenosine biosynthesis protein TsaB
MALILSIETATTICSVALHREGKLVRFSELDQENVHAKHLMLSVEGIFNESGLKPSDLAAVAISSGPGSYTGLRIGVSVAKGLAFAFNIPLIAVDTLEALAYQASPLCDSNDIIIPFLDARRMEVYTAVYNGNVENLESLHALEVEENPFRNYLENGRVFFLGDGLKKLKPFLDHKNAVFLSNLNSAVSVGILAFQKFSKGCFEDIAYFEPNYLKEFRVLASKKNPLLI